MRGRRRFEGPSDRDDLTRVFGDVPDAPESQAPTPPGPHTTSTVLTIGVFMQSYRLIVLGVVTLMTGNFLQAQDAYQEFTPRNGFSGPSAGNGSLRLLFGRPRPFHVQSYGYDRPDGTFQLDQTVTFQGKRLQTRSWVMTTVGYHQYAATLSDAAGPVAARTDGNRLFLRYRAKGPLVVHQTLELMPDGRTIDNVGRITLLGLPVGRLHETIIRTD